MNNTTNTRQLLINEISLEGLDGITLQALWVRISEATKTTLPFPEKLEEQYWKIICVLPDFEFYELEKPRGDYIPFNRFLYTLDDRENTYLEPEEYPDEIYPYKLVNDTEKGIVGSCATYITRKNITTIAQKTTYAEAKEKWGSKLVIVASQELRNIALMGYDSKNLELTAIQFCILERIGRARHYGEITQGKRSLQVIGEDPKSLFYHRKTLLKHKLITKQIFHIKNKSQNCSGSLLHLQRYYVERKPKYLLLTEKAVEFLKNKPNYRAEYSEVIKELNLTESTRKIFKCGEFQRFIHTDLKIPYREYYPNSTIAQWKQKNSDKEKLIRTVQLINPEIDVAENWYSRQQDDQGDEEDEELGFKNYENLCYGQSLLSQAAAIVREYGADGCTQSELGDIMGLGKLNARSLCRNLLRRNVVTCIMNDVGRQRVTRFVSRRFGNKGQMTLQFKQERDKMMNLLSAKKPKIEVDKTNPDEIDVSSVQSTSSSNIKTESSSTLSIVETDLNKTPTLNKINDERVSTVSNETESKTPEQPNVTNLKIEDTPSLNPRKRSLFHENTNDEPFAKISKTEHVEITKEMQENINRISVEISVTKHDPRLKGYSQGFEAQLQTEMLNATGIKPGAGSLTYRMLRRANFIIECVRQYKVIADLQKFLRMIQEDEQEEGYLVKIDKKSLVRLLLKLAKDGHVKYMKATLTTDEKTKTLGFVCEPTIDENHSIIQSEIEQAKMKFFIGSNKCVKEEKVGFSKTNGEVKKEKVKHVFDKKIARKLGFCPKFVRMRLIHELMFYLVYEQDQTIEPITTIEGKREWLQSLNIEFDDKIIEEMSPIHYKNELCWKTFIPPLQAHIGWPKGWTLICDILVRLPFKIFMQCCGSTFNVKGIQDFLNHPIKQFYLVRDLPLNMRNDLLYKRKYIFQMHEIISRLCYCGLIQFGPQKFKEKDQVFVYLNKKTSILDTSTSNPGYHEITPEEYEKHEYIFENHHDLEQYWYDLWYTCMNTRLGGRTCLTGKYVVIEHLETKQAMIDAVAPVLPEEAPLKDTGKVPGNNRGAAGLDSALFAHLKRNWSWHNNNELFDQTPKPPRNPKMKPVKETIKIPDPKNANEIIELEIKKQTVSGGTKQLNKNLKSKKSEIKSRSCIMKPKTVVRKIMPKSMPRQKKPVYDEIDKVALTKMEKLRTEWSPLEDHILLLCTIAAQYLCPNRRKQMISFSVIRDVLHKLIKSSSSKTSKACQRRTLYTMKNINTRRSVNMCLEEIRQNENITAQFKSISERIQKEYIPELELHIAFIDLVAQMTVMFSNIIKSSKRKSNFVLPSSLNEFKEKIHICNSPKKLNNKYVEPKNSDDIEYNVIKTVVHSSMCCIKDKTSWAYQLFKVYQQYPENLLRSAITKTRQEQLISVKKSFVGMKKKNSSMPLSSSPYKLSIMYYNHLLTKIPYGTYQDAYDLLMNIVSFNDNLDPEEINTTKGYEIMNPGPGKPIAIMEMLEKFDIEFKFEIPEEIIVLDQNIKNDKTYDRIVERFYNILRDPTRVQKWEEQNSKIEDEDEGNFPHIEELNKKNPDTTLNVSRHVTTRIAFHMMRAEICEGLDDISTQHLHDFFVVNACRVFIKFPNLINSGKTIDIEDFCEDFYEVKTKLTAEVLAEIRDTAIIPNKCPENDEITESITEIGGNESDLNISKTLLDFIESHEILGATLQDLKHLLLIKHEGNLKISDILETLIKVKIIIRSGVDKIHFIHYKHIKPWIINSYKILRLDREKIPPITQPSKEEIQEHVRKHKKNFSLLELQKSKLRLDLTSQQEIKVLMSPWIRIDGTLNRRVLDRWIGTMLITCLEQPGISLRNLMNKLHYLKPVDARSLIRYLTKLKCLNQYTLLKSKPSLFSSVPNIKLVPATGLEDPRDIIIEPTCDALTKLSIFIGKKAYSVDFLMQH